MINETFVNTYLGGVYTRDSCNLRATCKQFAALIPAPRRQTKEMTMALAFVNDNHVLHADLLSRFHYSFDWNLVLLAIVEDGRVLGSSLMDKYLGSNGLAKTQLGIAYGKAGRVAPEILLSDRNFRDPYISKMVKNGHFALIEHLLIPRDRWAISDAAGAFFSIGQVKAISEEFLDHITICIAAARTGRSKFLNDYFVAFPEAPRNAIISACLSLNLLVENTETASSD